MATRTRRYHGGHTNRHGRSNQIPHLELMVFAARVGVLLYAQHKARERARETFAGSRHHDRERQPFYGLRVHPDLVRDEPRLYHSSDRNRETPGQRRDGVRFEADLEDQRTERPRTPSPVGEPLRPIADHPPSVQRARDLGQRRRAYRQKECSVCGDRPESSNDIHAHLAPSCIPSHSWQHEIICTDCLKHYLELRMFPSDNEQNRFRFPASRVICWAPNCNEQLLTSTIQKYANAGMFLRYTSALDAQFLREDQSTLHCATENCPGAFWFDAEDEVPKIVFCKICRNNLCTECKDAYVKHMDRPCPSVAAQRRRAKDARLRKEEELSAAALRSGTSCPKCALPYQKISGCDHIVCGKDADSFGPSRGCGHEFCHRCFEPWRQHRIGCAYRMFG